MAEWIQLTTACDAQAAETLENALLELGAVSVTLQDVADVPIFEPDLGTTPLWPRTQLLSLFEQGHDMQQVTETLQATWPELSIQVEALADQNWETSWMSHYEPLKFGEHFWVVPSWLQPPKPQEPYIFLDPGLAFGTGTHETTALCLDWLSQQNLKDTCLLDYGCGSGILAVAALKLGCKTAYGIDIDPQALIASQHNAQLNQVQLTTFLPEQCPPSLRCDTLIANILYNPLMDLAPTLIQFIKPGGKIALSGLLQTQAEAIRERYQPWVQWENYKQRNEWCLLSGSVQ